MAELLTTSPREADAVRLRMKTLVIGLGNPLVTDDSVGLRVVEQLRGELAERSK